MIMLLPVFLPIIGALLIWCIPEERRAALNGFTLAVLAVSAAFAAAVALGREQALTVWRLTDTVSIALRREASL